MTARASGALDSLPAPSANAMGMRPKIADIAVMRMGRKRERQARIVASWSGIPSVRSSFA